MRRTTYNSVKAVFSLAPAARIDGAANGAAVDARQYRVATVVVVTGAMTDGSVAVTVEDSADGSTGWAAVPGARRQGALPTIADSDDGKAYEVGVIVDHARPYLRPVLTTSGATTGGLTSAVVLLGQPNTLPVSR